LVSEVDHYLFDLLEHMDDVLGGKILHACGGLGGKMAWN
jgi:hypothetical protein